MMIFEVLILAIIQAITEFLPVSSSGHLLAASELFGLNSTIGLDVMLHAGTLIALIIYFWDELIQIVSNLAAEKQLIRNIVLSTLPAAVLGIIFSDALRTDTRTIGAVIFMLVVVGLIMINLDRLVTKTKKVKSSKSLKSRQALTIGFMQAIALIPGTSRSGITIIGARAAGLDNKQAARYSFLIGIPIIAGAAINELFRAETQAYISDYPFSVLAGVTVAATVGLLVLGKLIDYVSKHGLAIFGWYRLALASVLFIIVLAS